MNVELLSLASELIKREQPFAVATVVRREAPSSAQLGDTAIVTPNGQLHGFIGGSCTRATVQQQALEVLSCGAARLISFHDDDRTRADDIVSVPMTCHSGGSVEIYIDPVHPAPRLLVLGSSPVTHAIARLGKAMGYSVHVAVNESSDDPPADADEILESTDGLEARYADREHGVKLYVLVATLGESDETMLSDAIRARPDYLGVIASRRRMEEIRKSLAERGVAADDIAAIRGPAGLDLGATRPEEVAVSVLAEIVASREATVSNAVAAAADAVAAEDAAGAVDTAEEIDPVCGSCA